MALSIKQVRYFIAAADAGQVSQAAIELNVSQSAVTAAIKQLESDLARSPVRPPVDGCGADRGGNALPAACAHHHGGGERGDERAA